MRLVPTRSPAPLRRRDLLRLRTPSRDRVLELSCQQLYMRYLEARRGRPDPAPLDDSALGEPDAAHDVPGVPDLIEGLTRDLATADVLRIVEREWLVDPDLRREVERLVEAFIARGGRVESGLPTSR